MRELGNKFDIGMEERKEAEMTLKDACRMGRGVRVQAQQRPRSMPSSELYCLKNPSSPTSGKKHFLSPVFWLFKHSCLQAANVNGVPADPGTQAEHWATQM